MLKNKKHFVLFCSDLTILVNSPSTGNVYFPKILFLFVLDDDLDLMREVLNKSLLNMLGSAIFLYLC